MIILPVCFFEDVAQGMYDTYGCIAIASEYGHDTYANALEFFHKKQHYMNILSSLCVVCKQDILFDSVESQ